MSKDHERINYILGLLGKSRESVVREVVHHRSPAFDTLLNMADQNAILKDTLVTKTSVEQEAVEATIKDVYDHVLDQGEPLPHLYRASHSEFLHKALTNPLPDGLKVLDASQPWIIYWCLNALTLMGGEPDEELKNAVSSKIISYIHKDGGIGGGVGQIGHVAATYAAVCSLALSEDTHAWATIDRTRMYNWLMSLKLEDNSFVMHRGGEVDTRAVYCVLCVASMLNILTPELTEGVAEWLSKCQTFEGGFGGTPYDEAHGGYTFCAVAALCVLGHPSKMLRRYCDLDKLMRWVSMRQLQLEGGFSGRTNKLVDGCYSHWVGGLVPFLEIACGKASVAISRQGISNYILICCQTPKFPGLIDKPGKRPDFYHTNYVLCGLSGLQHSYTLPSEDAALDASVYQYEASPIKNIDQLDFKEENEMYPINPVLGIPLKNAKQIKKFYSLSA